jgi:phosphoesterase RecJ-like protein
MRNEFKELVNAIEQHDSFLLLSHIDPDGDAIGSLMALLFLLRRRGKKAVASNQDGVPKIYRFLKGSDQIVTTIPRSTNFDAAIFLECPTMERAGAACAPVIERVPLLINIDHHVENSRFGHLNIVDPELCAVAEIVFDLFGAMGEPMDAIIAEALYAAIMTDTGSFKYPNTTPRAHETSAQLLRFGINPYDMYQRIYENLSVPAALIAACAHCTLEIQNGISCITITRKMLEETGATAEDTHDIVNLGRNISGVEAALLFREAENGIKVSLRSKTFLKVNEIAVRFGGGGHLKAAGCTIKGSMEQAKEQIFAAVRKALREARETDAGVSDH